MARVSSPNKIPDLVIAIGTTNPGKVDAVKQTFAGYPKLQGSVFATSKVVNTGVSDQPYTLSETMTGAKNRATAAWGAHQIGCGGGPCGGSGGEEASVWGVGMESGLFEDPQGKLFDLCACAIFDGERYHVGYSCAWALPDSLAECVRNGLDLSQGGNAIGLASDPKIGDKGGLIALLTGSRVTRPQYTVQSIQMALLAMNPIWYPCGVSVPPGINDAVAFTASPSNLAAISTTAKHTAKTLPGRSDSSSTSQNEDSSSSSPLPFSSSSSSSSSSQNSVALIAFGSFLLGVAFARALRSFEGRLLALRASLRVVTS